LKGLKSENEKFAGAEETYCVEALMQDGKALQAGTSHFLGQNFSKAFDVQFATSEGKKEFVWGTSWGVSTRLVGALIMTHSDDKGLVLPPNLAPIQVVLIPIFNSEEEFKLVTKKIKDVGEKLKSKNISIKIDDRKNHKPGWKFSEYELKGIPVRIVIGPKDLENNTVELARRDNLSKEIIDLNEVDIIIPKLLKEIQANLFNKAKVFREENTYYVKDYKEFKEIIKNKGGFIYAHWDGSKETENLIKKETKATIRCIPMDYNINPGKCIVTGKKSKGLVIFGKAY
jgi:prolyl-tRNA synthetase